ncbi:hypothetical protein AMELA_G00066620, partial [Ameiurus melas]
MTNLKKERSKFEVCELVIRCLGSCSCSTMLRIRWNCGGLVSHASPCSATPPLLPWCSASGQAVWCSCHQPALRRCPRL